MTTSIGMILFHLNVSQSFDSLVRVGGEGSINDSEPATVGYSSFIQHERFLFTALSLMIPTDSSIETMNIVLYRSSWTVVFDTAFGMDVEEHLYLGYCRGTTSSDHIA